MHAAQSHAGGRSSQGCGGAHLGPLRLAQPAIRPSHKLTSLFRPPLLLPPIPSPLANSPLRAPSWTWVASPSPSPARGSGGKASWRPGVWRGKWSWVVWRAGVVQVGQGGFLHSNHGRRVNAPAAPQTRTTGLPSAPSRRHCTPGMSRL